MRTFVFLYLLVFQVVAQQRVGCICEDNTVSEAIGAGACSGHGGVKKWLYDKDNPHIQQQKLPKTNSNLPTVIPPMDGTGGQKPPNFDSDEYEEVRIEDPKNDKKQPNDKDKRKRVGCECEDGTFSQATGTGACAGHGGVARWLYGGERLGDNTAPTLKPNTKDDRKSQDEDDGSFSFNDFERAGSLLVYILALVLVFLKVGWVLRKVMNRYLGDD
jgi:hypothetical protein